MPDEIRYYQCPNCGRTPHIIFKENMKDKIIEIECEFCLCVFEVDDKKDPPVEPQSIEISRGIKPS